jgi:hypothetical protein
MTTESLIQRPYSDDDVERLRGSVTVEHTLARRGALRLRALLEQEDCVSALGALTGGQAVQMVKAGLKAIYLSGWQVAADANLSARPTPIRASTRQRVRRPSSSGSTTRCCAPTRSPTPRATTRPTGSRRSSPTPRPASAGR